MSRQTLWIAAGLVVVLALPAWAVTAPAPKFTYYMVSGNTPAEVYAAIVLRGPKVRGEPAIAATWAVAKQKSSLARSPSACRISSYGLTLSFVIRLPRIKDARALTPEDRALWEQFTEFLKAHELRHTKLWISCAQDLERQASSIRTSSCAEASRRSKALWKKVMDRCDAQQAAFDADQRMLLLGQPFMQKVLRGVQ